MEDVGKYLSGASKIEVQLLISEQTAEGYFPN